MNHSFVALFTGLALFFGLATVYPVIGAEPANQGKEAKSKATVQENIIKYTPNMRVSSMTGRPETDTLELPSGRRMSLGDARRLEAGAQKMRGAVRGSGKPAALKLKPASTGTPIKTGSDLAAALKRPDSDTVQLPDGKLVTVAQLKYAKPLVEKRLGRKLDTPAKRPNLSGDAIKVGQNTSKAQWVDILKKPDSTVLESSNGKRVSLGELKQYMGQSRKAFQTYPSGKPGSSTSPQKTRSGVTPQKSAPAVTPKQR